MDLIFLLSKILSMPIISGTEPAISISKDPLHLSHIACGIWKHNILYMTCVQDLKLESMQLVKIF